MAVDVPNELQKRTLLFLSAAHLLGFTAACNQPETPVTPLPETIALPNGFQPGGVAAGSATTLYAGSLADGAVYQTAVTTGEGSVLVAGERGRVNVGLTFGSRLGHLFAAGGTTGKAYVYDTKAGLLETVTLATTKSAVNDAVLSGNTVYFTDSSRAVLYRLALGEEGALPEGDSGVNELPITGAFTRAPDPMAFDANGTKAADDGILIIFNTTTGQLFTVNPDTGESAEIGLGDGSVENGDGILLGGSTLYVVQNQGNKIAVVELSKDLSSGAVTNTLTNPALDFPSTLADIDTTLYAVNARFGTDPTPETEYAVVEVER